MLEHLHSAAVELEISLLRMLPDMCAEDVYNFWTSLQLHEHLHHLAQRIRGRYSVEVYTDILMRWIGSYAAQFRPPVLTSLTDANPSAIRNDANVSTLNRRKRGRPAKLSSHAKQSALEARSNGKSPEEVTAILYDVKYPTRRQISNSYANLANYKRTLGALLAE